MVTAQVLRQKNTQPGATIHSERSGLEGADLIIYVPVMSAKVDATNRVFTPTSVKSRFVICFHDRNYSDRC